MSVKSTIVSEFEEVAAKQGKIIRPLSDELILSESGLDFTVLRDFGGSSGRQARRRSV